jgi:hypothetical protein
MKATPTFAGIDWSWQHHALCIVDGDGHRVDEVTVADGKPGLSKRKHVRSHSPAAAIRFQHRPIGAHNG